MTRILTAAIAIAVLAAAVASLSIAGAQSEIDVRENNARSAFPNGTVLNPPASPASGRDAGRPL